MIQLRVLLADLPVGSWVVLDHDMTKILGKGETPDDAVHASRAVLTEGERPVIVQVRDWMASEP